MLYKLNWQFRRGGGMWTAVHGDVVVTSSELRGSVFRSSSVIRPWSGERCDVVLVCVLLQPIEELPVCLCSEL